VLRWSLLAISPSLVLLWPIQALHALSFAATHVAALRLVLREAPEEVAGLGQTLYAALAAGALIGIATLASGLLYESFGAGGYWVMAALAVVGLWIVAPLERS
jgi:PPP family 3-phenylpropionic acid transporter